MEDADAAEVVASPSRGFLDLRTSGSEKKKHTVPRKSRSALVLGLDGAGKSRLCTALARPCDVDAALSRSIPTDVALEVGPNPDGPPALTAEVDDRWIVKRAEHGGGFPQGNIKLPPTTRIELWDVPGAAAFRPLWQPMADGEFGVASGAENGGSSGPDVLVFVIGAHDVARIALAWSELVALARHVPAIPLYVVVARTRSAGPVMSPADVLRAAEDFEPLVRADGAPWTIAPIDLRALEERPGEMCMYQFSDLRKLVQWVTQVSRA